MIAIIYLNWFSGKRSNKDVSQEGDIPEYHTSIKAFLEYYNIDDEAIRVYVVESLVEIESTDDYLNRYGVPEGSIKSLREEIKSEVERSHKNGERGIILKVLAVQMLVIPLWMMVLLTLAAFEEDVDISQPMQGAYLTAVASDFAGLYYIVTRDLFPRGNGRSSKDDDDDDDAE